MVSLRPAPFSVRYGTPAVAAAPDTLLAQFWFSGTAGAASTPACIRVPLRALGPSPLCEFWTVAATVAHGQVGPLRWSAGGGWRLTVVELDERAHGGIEAASEQAYRLLLAHLARSAEPHPLRVWNYFGAINDGHGDAERYRLFCNGRARGMAAGQLHGYPAATAIGHHAPGGCLQVYALSASHAGAALENPRQVSAWQYPREYGPTAPSFARAMRLPDAALAISGTAAVVGHASCHHDDLLAQLAAALANLQTLLDCASLPAFDAACPLKVYLRDAADADVVRSALTQALGASVPVLLLHGDVCRRELLVEIDGWRFVAPPRAHADARAAHVS